MAAPKSSNSRSERTNEDQLKKSRENETGYIDKLNKRLAESYSSHDAVALVPHRVRNYIENVHGIVLSSKY